ncbi:MAG: hypothetical protein IMF08_12810 [Proteobacteria bacterium]|nr:hypothetical protein [Pseudomonadota bacterium]
MPVSFSEVVKVFDIDPIETDEEPVELRVEILHEEGATPPYSARIWRRATILLRPAEAEEGAVEEYRILIEDETIGGEAFEGDTIEEILDQIRHRIRAAWYIPR